MGRSDGSGRSGRSCGVWEGSYRGGIAEGGGATGVGSGDGGVVGLAACGIAGGRGVKSPRSAKRSPASG